VEGYNTNNQWWEWEQQGRCWRGDVSGAACNWWQNAEADLDRAQALGTNAHRMSVEWSRIEPQEGRFDPSALRRYREILEGIRSRGMIPMVTLHHFTNPLWMEAQGGWLNPAAPQKFGRFVERTVAELGDLCDLWCTVNEPTVAAALGYVLGHFPPGRTSVRESLRAFGGMVRAHQVAARIIHSLHPAHRVGIVHHKRVLDPATPAKRDVLVTAIYDWIYNGRLLQVARASSDFFGMNYYSRDHVAFDARAPFQLFGRRFTPEHFDQSDKGFLGVSFGEIYPEGLYRSLKRVYRRLKMPIYITETGLPDEDDDQRPYFILSHLAALHRAIRDGVDVRGVFLWSLIDNFEWAEGWDMRFGLYAMDERTGERRLRPSGALYGIIARANAIPGPRPLPS
jgi:beta-glucosidase